jgi:hypothetical protein
MQYQKISTWGLTRILKKQPHSFLFDLEGLDTKTIQFKLQGQPCVLCNYRQLESLESTQKEAYKDLGLDGAKNLSEFNIGTHIFKLERWLSTLQKYFGVLLTHHIEHEQHLPLLLSQMIEEPLKWALFHLTFQSDLRKSIRPQDQQMQVILDELTPDLDIPLYRITTPNYGSVYTLHFRRRKLHKLIDEVTDDKKSYNVSDFGSLLEWQRQMSELIIWAIVMLNSNQNLYTKIKTEIQDQLEADAYKIEYLSQLPTLTCFIMEILRQAPPHWITTWGSLKDMSAYQTVFEGLHPKTKVFTAPVLSQRNPIDWPSSDTFQPDRFFAIIHGAEVPFSFMPFGPGEKGRALTLTAVHTIANILVSIMRRGHFVIDGTEMEQLKNHIHPNGLRSAEEWVGVGYGAPRHLIGRLIIDDSYIYIPSTRV